MKNINAQEWLDKKYPVNGTCQRNNDPENKGKRREDITKLDISKGNLGKRFYNDDNGDKNLFGNLKLAGFTSLRELIISSHQLTCLDVNDCFNLEELDCHGNKLAILNVNNCSNLRKIDCSDNNLKELDLRTCNELEEIDINGNPKLTVDKIKPNFVLNIERKKLVQGPIITQVKEDDVRNILIVGITGSGKSTLANVLTNTNEFRESNFSTSITRNFQTSDIFEHQDKKYRLIDNIGFGDTAKITEEEILFKIGEGIHEAREGINQVLFVFKDKFAPEHVEAFSSFERFVSKSRIIGFTTLVRTNFGNFRTKDECERDKDSLLAQNQEVRKIIDSCKAIIHVDNSPAQGSDNENETRISEKKRRISKEKVLNHLAENCLEIYKLKEWNNISSMVDDYIKRKEEIEKSNISVEAKEEAKAKIRNQKGKEIGASLEANVGVPLTAKAWYRW